MLDELIHTTNNKNITNAFYDSKYHKTDKKELIKRVEDIKKEKDVCTCITLDYTQNRIEFCYITDTISLSYNISNMTLLDLKNKDKFIEDMYRLYNYHIIIVEYTNSIEKRNDKSDINDNRRHKNRIINQ